MKEMVRNISTILYSERVTSWIKLVTITGGVQVIVQVVGLISGIIVIRLLPTKEYGLYTLANTMLGTMVVLSDGGILVGVMSQSANVWKDREKLGSVLATGFSMIRKFAIGSFIVSTPFLIYLLVLHKASSISVVLIIFSLIPAFYATLSDSMLEIAPKLHQSILPLQKNQVNVGLGRLLLTGLTMFLFPWAYVAILASSMPRIYGNIRLRKIATFFSDTKQLPDPIVRKEIFGVWKKSMPGYIYYCLSGQLTIWLISLFGNTTSIAQIGALGRIVTLLNLFPAVFTTLVAPRFARLPDDSKILKRKMIQIQSGILVFCICVIAFTYLFSRQILWLLGNNYVGLDNELLLIVTGGCTALMSGLIYVLCSGRAWILTPLIYITGSLLAIIAGLKLFNVSSLKGVLMFNIFISVFQLIMYLVFSWVKINKRSQVLSNE